MKLAGNRLANSVLNSTALILTLCLVAPASAATDGDDGKLSLELRAAIMAPVRKKLDEIRSTRSEEGLRNKQVVISRTIETIDDQTYGVSIHVNTAEETRLTTEKLLVHVVRVPDKKMQFELGEIETVDTLSVLTRGKGGNCYPFDKFAFDREGMRMSADDGVVCEYYFDGKVNVFGVGADTLVTDYTPPEYSNPDFPMLARILKDKYRKDVEVEPQAFIFECDSASCEEILEESFTGLDRLDADSRTFDRGALPEGIPTGLREYIRVNIEKRDERRRENPFADFEYPDAPGQSHWSAKVYKNDNHFSWLKYDNWGGYELEYHIYKKPDDAAGLTQPISGMLFGYYTQETLAKYSPYELEQRDDFNSRWYEVESLSGQVDLALDDPEMLGAELTFGINLKQDMDVLPFFIASVPGSGGQFDKRALFVNSIRMDGKELTWVKTGPISGLVVLPEPHLAGDRVDITMAFMTKAIKRTNYAASQMSRFGWMPFVRFGDFIDDFEMTVRSPAQYDILGVGHRVSDTIEGEVRTTEWKADNPVVFPTIIFGKYYSDTTKDYDAKKLDGTVIPVRVYVDEVSMNQLDSTVTRSNVQEQQAAFSAGARGIRASDLRPIAAQAAVSINLYSELSGVDYPYGELNLVNDPAPALYGQAPSSLIYLGSMVFRGEATMAATTGRGGGTSTAKFLKSVTAHEVGHQWWGSRVSNANQRNYWFVETLAEYFSALYLEQVYGRKEYLEQVEEWRRNVIDRDMWVSVQNASTHLGGEIPGASYQAAVYNKGPYMFHSLRETFGDEKFFPYLKKFSQELTAQREIVSRDIQNSSEKNLGGIGPDGKPYTVDLDWFFGQWLRGAGVPQYRVDYDVRRAESGDWIIEGVIEQRVVVGSSRSMSVLEGQAYRGVMDVTVLAKKGHEFKSRVLIDGTETPFRLSVPEKPLEVAINRDGGMLSFDVKVNVPW